MNRAKFFIILTFLLAFVLQVSAQDEKPKIVWKNLQERYESFVEIKPLIQNINEKAIYLYPSLKISVMVFDDELNAWSYSKYMLITCSFGSQTLERASVKIKPNESLEITKWIYWNYELLGERGVFQPFDKPDWEDMPDYKTGRKYKLQIKLSEKRYENLFDGESPEFWVKPNI